MMDARELKDVELKEDVNGVQEHIYVRVANILSNAEFDQMVEQGQDVTGLLPGIQFAICDKTDLKAPENTFYLNAYDLNFNLNALLPLVNYNAQKLTLLPDSMLYALSDNPLDHLIQCLVLIETLDAFKFVIETGVAHLIKK